MSADMDDELKQLRERIQKLGGGTALPPDPTPDLCCTHGEALVQRIERAVELIEDVHAARVGNAHQHEPEPNEHQALIWKAARDEVLARPSTGDTVTDHDGQHPGLATGGLVKGPGGPVVGGGWVITFDPRGERVFTAEDMSPEAQAALEKFQQSVASDSVPAHISPAESVIPSPNGPIHIRHAYGDQPAEFTVIDMDDLEDDED